MGRRDTTQCPSLGRMCLLHMQLPDLEAGALLQHCFQGITEETQSWPNAVIRPGIFLSD